VRRWALALGLALACSAPLEGELASQPVADWSFLAEADDVALATASGRRFRTVQAEPFAHEGALYLYVSTILPASDAALDELRSGAELRLRARGSVHPLRAVELTTGAEIDPILPTLVRETLAIEATGLRWDPEPARYPGTQIRRWLFRLEPASG
jgi:hypothetical protein